MGDDDGKLDIFRDLAEGATTPDEEDEREEESRPREFQVRGRPPGENQLLGLSLGCLTRMATVDAERGTLNIVIVQITGLFVDGYAYIPLKEVEDDADEHEH